MYWDESPVENRGRGVCISVCVCTEGCSILDKNSLKGKRTPTVLICSVSVFYCHALRSHPLLSLPLLICLYSTHHHHHLLFLSPLLFSLPGIPDTFISISHTVIFIFFSLSLSIIFLSRHLFVCLCLFIFFYYGGEPSRKGESYWRDGHCLLVLVVRHQTLVCWGL